MGSFRQGIRVFRSQDIIVESRPCFFKRKAVHYKFFLLNSFSSLDSFHFQLVRWGYLELCRTRSPVDNSAAWVYPERPQKRSHPQWYVLWGKRWPLKGNRALFRNIYGKCYTHIWILKAGVQGEPPLPGPSCAVSTWWIVFFQVDRAALVKYLLEMGSLILKMPAIKMIHVHWIVIVIVQHVVIIPVPIYTMYFGAKKL